MEKRIENYWNKLEADEITFAEFLRSMKKDLGVVALIIDPTVDQLKVVYGDSGEEVVMSEGQWPKINETEVINIADHLVELKHDFSALLNDEKYHDELGEFLDKYKLTKIDFNLQNDEVKFYSGNTHLVEGLDYDNQ